MSVTITINGQIILDQSPGSQDSDVEVTNGVGGLGGALDSDFLAFLNGLSLTAAQKNFAAFVEGASEPDLVSVSATAGETIKSLFFSDAAGNDLNGDLVVGVTLLDGSPLYLWSMNGGKEVIVTTSNVDATSGDIAAAFFLESNNAANTEAKVQSITFQPLLHPDASNADDSVNFTDILKVSAAVVITTPIGGDIIVDDDGPSIVTSDDGVNLTVDETVLTTDATTDFANQFTHDFGTDGGTSIAYKLEATAGASGLTDTATGDAVILSLTVGGVVEGRTAAHGNVLVFTVSVSGSSVTLDQRRAVVHTDTTNPDDSTTLSADDLVRLVATITDADGDQDDATLNIGQNLIFEDDGPSIQTTGDKPTITADESDLVTNPTGNFAPNFSGLYVADGAGSTTFDLGATNGVVAGLLDELTGETVALSKNAVTGNIEARTTVSDLLVFTVSVSALGVVTFDQARSITHANAADPNDTRVLGPNAADIITLTATITDKDGDHAAATLNIGDALAINDDGPTIPQPLDTDPSTPAIELTDNLGNKVGQHADGTFGYLLGADAHNAAFYTGGGSDFGDSNPNVLGTQLLTLTGTVDNPQNPGITNVQTSLASEDAAHATFNWSFHYDADPITTGVQDSTAGGTLTFNKVAHTYTATVTDVVDGFSFDVLHTSELQAKAPPGNTGHPELVVEQLQAPSTPGGHDGFFVQFTSNSNPNGNPFGFNATGDGSPNANDTHFDAGQQLTSNFEDWVSATGSTNGVAGDTIQKGELLTLRFFGEDILGDVNPGAPGGGTEKIDPTTSVSGVAVKFDGIGQSEDLMVVLNLIDKDGADNILGNADDGFETTVSLRVDNGDIIKGNANVPAPYNSEFTLDNNDGLVIIESNDYNTGTQNFQIQGIQIMQSGNGLTGTAINLNGATTTSPGGGASVGTQDWDNDVTSKGVLIGDTDVLKITDIGFIQQTTGTIDANLDFAFNVQDGDFDPTALQHLGVHISNDFIV